MKQGIILAATALTGCVAIAFGAEKKEATDTCTETYDKALLSCKNEQANCKARGSEPTQCEQRFKVCENNAAKAKQDCQNKSGQKPSASPAKPKH